MSTQNEALRAAARSAAERSQTPRPQLHIFYTGYEAAFADFMLARTRRKSAGALSTDANVWDEVLKR